MVVAFEYSKDFNTWIDKIDGKRIEDYTVLGSYDIRQGYNLTETPRSSTFSMDVVSSHALAQALLEYRYIRVKKDGEVTFIGQLTDESERKIETLETQVLTIKYVHLLSMFEEKTFGAKDFSLNYIEADGMKVLDNSDPTHSLTHILVNNYLLKGLDIPFVLENEYSMPVSVVDFNVVGTEKVWEVLNQLLREYGYIIRIENLTLKIVDILKTSDTGVELLDGAEISKRQTNEPLTIPRVKYLETLTEKNVTLYKDRYSIGGILWIGKTLEGDLALTFDEADGKKMQSIANLSYKTNDLDVQVKEQYLNEDKRSFHRKLHLGFGSLYHISTETLTGDVTYAIYKNSVDADILPEGFVQTDEYIEPRYLYTYESVERYLESLTRIKLFKKAEWKFYSKVKLNVDDIVRFKDIPDSTCRIFEVQDTLEMDGGYTYRAYPYPANNMTFVNKEEYVAPFEGNVVESIEAAEPIFIENGKYKKPSWRIYIQCENVYMNPDVKVDGVDAKLEYDNNVKKYYVDAVLTDTTKTFIEVDARIYGEGLTKQIEIYNIKDAKEYPPVVEYRYSNSNEDPQIKSFDIAYNTCKLSFGGCLLSYSNTPWQADVPRGPEYRGMYLWKRTWNYLEEKWIYEMISGEKGDTIQTTMEYTLSTSDIENTGTVWTREVPEWHMGYYIWYRYLFFNKTTGIQFNDGTSYYDKVQTEALQRTAVFSFEMASPTYEINRRKSDSNRILLTPILEYYQLTGADIHWKSSPVMTFEGNEIIIPKTTDADKISITMYADNMGKHVEATNIILAKNTTEEAIYIGDRSVDPTEASEGFLLDGDYYLKKVTTGDTSTIQPMIYINGAWRPLTPTDYDYNKKIMDMTPDVFKDTDKNHIGTDAYDFFKSIIAENITAEMIGAMFIQILGAIYGGIYNKDGTINEMSKDEGGFHLDSKGHLQASNVELDGSIAVDHTYVKKGAFRMDRFYPEKF